MTSPVSGENATAARAARNFVIPTIHRPHVRAGFYFFWRKALWAPTVGSVIRLCATVGCCLKMLVMPIRRGGARAAGRLRLQWKGRNFSRAMSRTCRSWGRMLSHADLLGGKLASRRQRSVLCHHGYGADYDCCGKAMTMSPSDQIIASGIRTRMNAARFLRSAHPPPCRVKRAAAARPRSVWRF